MEVSFSELKEKEIINVFDGRKLGRIIDILFDNSTGVVKGIVVPGEKRIFRKGDDIFIPLEKLKKIGDDVILVGLNILKQKQYDGRDFAIRNYATQNDYYVDSRSVKRGEKIYKYIEPANEVSQNESYVRYKRIDKKKYK